jgi:hypothetical protein
MRKNWTKRKPGKLEEEAVIVHGTAICTAGLSLVQWGVSTKARKVLSSLSNKRYLKYFSVTDDGIF